MYQDGAEPRLEIADGKLPILLGLVTVDDSNTRHARPIRVWCVGVCMYVSAHES